jgi:hypothetical protein
MVLFLRQYGYLVSMLILLAICLSGMITFPKQRVGMMLSACFFAPFALGALVFVPDYWRPILVVPFPVGLEDIIFCFSVGGVAWLLAVWPQRERLRLGLETRVALVRLTACGLPCVLLSVTLRREGLPIMTNVILTMVLLAVVLLWLRPRFLSLALTGALGFSLFYFLFARAALAICPLDYWNVGKLWGYRLFRVPLEEIVWATGHGFVWPLVMAYVLDAELVTVPGELAPTAQQAIRGK